MNTTTDRHALHSIRDAQLKALCYMPQVAIGQADGERITHFASLCGRHYDTRNLSDKALEEIDSLAGKYLERAS